MRYASAEDGGIVTGWLLQLVLVMALLGVLGYEAISVAVTTITLDDTARRVAAEARDAYRSGNDLRSARAAAEAAAEQREVELLELEADDADVHVTVADEASTLFVHRIAALDSVTHPTARGRARWRP